MKTSRIVSLLALAGLAAGAFVYWPQIKDKVADFRKPPASKTATTEVRPPAITVVKVENADFVETAIVSGTIVAREETLISPEIEGYRVVELFVDEGSEVKKGQVLARLVADQLDAQIAQNEANKASAEAAIARAKSQIAEADARRKEAAAQLERAVPLKKSGYMSEAVFDQRESAAAATDAQLAAARDGLKAAEAQKAQVEAQRRELDWRRGNTDVKSPVDGIVSRRNARIGALATAAGEPMFRIITNGDMELDAEIIETEIAKIKAGQKAFVSVPGTGEITGVVRLVSPEIDRVTRLGRAKILLGKNTQLHTGAFGRGRIETATGHGLGVPPGAVLFDTSGAYVQVVDNGKIKRREVKTGLVASGRVEITSGLAEGDVIVARAGTFLRDGDTISPVVAGAQVSGKTAEVQ